MRNRTAVIAKIALVGLLGVTTYMRCHRPATLSADQASRPAPENEVPSLTAPIPQQVQSVKPPPPPNTGIQVSMPRPEPVRTLIESADEQLRQVEQFLPTGARIATYPIDQTHLKAALVSADLDGDGTTEIVVVHSNKPATDTDPLPQLFLSVLTREGGVMKVRSSTSLADGGVLFKIDFDGVISSLAVQDVTGDKRPEILVASGVGASLGGTLQVYTVEGSSLHQLGTVAGHSFYLRHSNGNKPSSIMARWRDDTNVTVYEWTRSSFKQIGKMSLRAM